jgi:hypothetical protein
LTNRIRTSSLLESKIMTTLNIPVASRLSAVIGAAIISLAAVLSRTRAVVWKDYLAKFLKQTER